MRKSLVTTVVAGALALSMAFATAAFADPAGVVDPPSANYTSWVNANGNKYWFDNGVMARGKEIFDPGSNAWCWLDDDGIMAHNKDVYLRSNGGKWVYYAWITGIMAHGERFVNYDGDHTGWYLFDQVTGAMFHGDTYIRSNDGKWVRYDRVTGKIVKGLHYQDGAYYYFDQTTGAMAHSRVWVPE